MSINRLVLACALANILLASSQAQADPHPGLITCDEWMSLDTNCAAQVGSLEPVQSYLTTFNISYTMTCNPGITVPRPSALRVIIHTENGQTAEKTISFTSSESFGAVDGMGPVELVDTHPEELRSRKFQAGCALDIQIVTQKSARKIAAEATLIAEVENFIATQPTVLNETFRLLVEYKADILATEKNEAAMACLIKRYESDSLYTPVVEGMKTTFAVIFHADFFPGLCTSDQESVIIQNDCASDDISRICIYKKAYFSAREKIAGVRPRIEAYFNNAALGSFQDRLAALRVLIGAQELP